MKNRLIKTLLILAFILCFCSPLAASALTPCYEPTEEYKQSEYYDKLLKVELTGNYHKDLAAVALTQVGYHEGNSIKDLGGKNAAGSGNYTEYGYYCDLQAEWCALFISWCARQAKIPESVICNNGWATAGDFGCEFRWKEEYTPVPGDLIIFDYPPYNKTTVDPELHGDHIGIVVSVDQYNVYTVEGNASNRCAKNGYALTNANIKGYGIYKDAESPETSETEPPASESSDASVPESSNASASESETSDETEPASEEDSDDSPAVAADISEDPSVSPDESHDKGFIFIPGYKPEVEKKSIFKSPWIYLSAAAVIAIAVASFLIIRKSKAKQQ